MLAREEWTPVKFPKNDLRSFEGLVGTRELCYGACWDAGCGETRRDC